MRLRLRLCDRGENFHAGSFIQLRAVRESRNAITPGDRKLKDENKYAGEHQRDHPDQIDVEPRAA